MNCASSSLRRDRNQTWRLIVGVFATASAFSPTTRADQAIIISNRDNTLYESPTGHLSNGAGVSMFVGRTNIGLNRRAVLNFDVAGAIPAGATITSASLTLQLTQTTVPTQNIDMHRLIVDWGEGTSVAPGAGGQGAPSTPGDATWIHTFYNGSFWNNSGGDFLPIITASQTTGDVGSYTWTSTQLIADVQDMLNSPGANFGWILIGDETFGGAADRFATREDAFAGFRPTLTINFTTVPEPGVLALIALGAAACCGLRQYRESKAQCKPSRSCRRGTTRRSSR